MIIRRFGKGWKFELNGMLISSSSAYFANLRLLTYDNNVEEVYF